MNPLESAWFFRMVEQGGTTPTDRLLAVFNVTQNWVAAPGIRENLLVIYSNNNSTHPCLQLRGFLLGLAVAAGVEKPEILASHLVILLQGAVAEELRHPELQPIAEAANAARAVIAQSRIKAGRARYALMTAGGVAATVLASFLAWQMLTPTQSIPSETSSVVITASQAVLIPSGISPTDMEVVLNLHEQFERGICQAPQLLMLPPGQVTAYTNVINFRTPENPAADRENLKALMDWFKKTQSAECYYAPKNGHTTVTWTKG